MRGLHGQKITIEDAYVAHRHATHFEQIVWLACEQVGFQAVGLLNVLLRQNGQTSCHAPNQGQYQGLRCWQGRAPVCRVAHSIQAVQATHEAHNGQIIVARLGDEVTVKRLYRTAQRIELRPENSDYPTLTVTPADPFAIEGLAVGLVRSNLSSAVFS